MGDSDRHELRTSRRAVIVGAGTAGVAAFVAGCASSVSKSSPVSPSPTANETIEVSDIPVGGGKIYAQSNIVVTQPTVGSFKAFDATCTHQGCQVASVAGGSINCPCHNAQFSISDGSVLAGPAPAPLDAKTVTVSGNQITVT